MVDGISLSFFTATFLFYPRTNVSEIIVFFPAAFDRLVVANTPTAEPPARRGSSPIVTRIIFYTRDAHQTKTVIILLKYRKPYILIYYYIAMVWYSERRAYINRATCCRDSNNWCKSYVIHK